MLVHISFFTQGGPGKKALYYIYYTITYTKRLHQARAAGKPGLSPSHADILARNVKLINSWDESTRPTSLLVRARLNCASIASFLGWEQGYFVVFPRCNIIATKFCLLRFFSNPYNYFPFRTDIVVASLQLNFSMTYSVTN